MLEVEPLDVEKVVARIMGNFHVERVVNQRDGLAEVELTVSNYTRSKKSVKVVEMCRGEVEVNEADGASVREGTITTVSWNLTIEPDQEVTLRYKCREVVNRKPYVEGIEPEILSGGEVMPL